MSSNVWDAIFGSAIAANFVLASPNGSAGPLTPRALVTADLPAGTGTVTSVAQTFTGGLISVAGSPITTSGTLALTVAGTSGGVPYFSSTSAWASSALLASGGLVLGGGAGNPPLTNTQLTFSAPTLTVGLAGTSSGILALTGSTSGSATLTAPAVAGTVTNNVTSSNGMTFPSGSVTVPSVAVRQSTQGMSASSTSVVNLICGIQGGNIQFGDTTSAKVGVTSNANALIQTLVGGSFLTIQGQTNGQTNQSSILLTNGATMTGVSPNAIVNVGGTFAPTSGTSNWFDLLLTPTINQTSTGNGTTRILAAYPVNTALLGTQYLLALGTSSAANAGGTLTDKFLIDNTGIVKNYFGIATVSQGVPAEYATVDLTAQTADIGATTMYAVPAAGAGMYRVSAYIVVSQAATTSSTLPKVQIKWTDNDNNTVQTSDVTVVNSGNVLTTFEAGVQVLNAKASTNIQYVTTGTATSGGTALNYALHLKLEAM